MKPDHDAKMTVYYSENGRALHYYPDCHQLESVTPDALNTADEVDLGCYVCVNCAERRSLSERSAPDN